MWRCLTHNLTNSAIEVVITFIRVLTHPCFKKRVLVFSDLFFFFFAVQSLPSPIHLELFVVHCSHALYSPSVPPPTPGCCSPPVPALPPSLIGLDIDASWMLANGCLWRFHIHPLLTLPGTRTGLISMLIVHHICESAPLFFRWPSCFRPSLCLFAILFLLVFVISGNIDWNLLLYLRSSDLLHIV